MNKRVLIVGAGIAGMEAAAGLSSLNYEVLLFEKDEKPGGHLKNWERLFPTQRLGSEVLEFLEKGIGETVKLISNTNIISAEKSDKNFKVVSDKGDVWYGDALLITTGYDLFEARKKEEYGHGIYDNVFTSAELESLFLNKKELLTHQNKKPARIGFIHCVGSRDKKVGNVYCSKVCCVTAVKQAIEVREKLPECEVYCFYMDLRMYGMHFEELYNEAQEKWGVTFIRGRLSETAENIDKSLQIKVEDTLLGRPLRMTVDMLVLMVGFVPSKSTTMLGKEVGIDFNSNGFLKTMDEHTSTNITGKPGVFVAGTCTSPQTITNTIIDGRSAALTIHEWLSKSGTV
ncbi:MAG: FAD-dependent oxidoreductase [Bacteroidetes bacterium HGW-Bacteroidetes-21]|jgi:heterodisulfide reductase subunit A|nr:MAG: FAD-dependent oxidoreductase [Bacteroidetes bacterium HGW-Bacteroidetes-21]